MDTHNKELEVVQNQTSKAIEVARGLIIDSDAKMSEATEILKKIKVVGKMITEKKELITKPINQALKEAREMFKPLESDCSDAEREIKNKMIAYQNEVETKRKKELEKIEKKVENGTMKIETAIKKVDKVQEVPTSVTSGTGSISTRIIKKVRIVDESIIPREYLIPDIKKIEAVAKAGVEIPGVELYEEKSIAIR